MSQILEDIRTATMPTKVNRSTVLTLFLEYGHDKVLDNVNDIPYVVMVLSDLLRGTSQKKVSPSSQSWFSGKHGHF